MESEYCIYATDAYATEKVKKKIVKKYKVEGFVSLVKSAGVLQKVLEALGLTDEKAEKREKIQEEERIELVFGNATEIFNSYNNIDYYLFALRSGEDSSTIVYVRVCHPLMNFKDLQVSANQPQKFLNFDIVKYFKRKDPTEN